MQRQDIEISPQGNPPTVPSQSPSSPPLRIAVVGDVHDHWDAQDAVALHHLQVDLVLLVGDFGNEAVSVVAQIAALDIPKAIIFGNHDAWYTATAWGRKKCPYDRALEDRVQAQLDLVGAAHVGYGKLDFPQWGVSIVGGRPFSWGGSQWTEKTFYRDRFGVHNWEESTDRILQAAATATEETLIFMGHCGPTGLGDTPEAPCGRDWQPLGGDFGDPDLGAAIAHSQGRGKAIPLVVFGHMHHTLRHRQDCLRQTWILDAQGTVYLNAAWVPRIVRSGQHCRRHFSLVTLANQRVTTVEQLWIDQDLAITDHQTLFSAPSPSIQTVASPAPIPGTD